MSALVQLRMYSRLEGTSLLLLVLVAMPLKYLLGLPLAARILGTLHGLSFLLFVSALVRAATELHWSSGRCLRVLAWSLLPGGMFVLERAIPRELSASS